MSSGPKICGSVTCRGLPWVLREITELCRHRRKMYEVVPVGSAASSAFTYVLRCKVCGLTVSETDLDHMDAWIFIQAIQETQ